MEILGSTKGLEVIFISLGGMLSIYLGYRLLVTGANQPFKIFSDLIGWRFRVANLGPGVFFAVLGALILCSSVTANIVAILQKESFVNTYATKLILDELNKSNQIILSQRLEKGESSAESASKVSSTTSHSPAAKLRQSNRAMVVSNGLHLRKEPGTSHQIVGSLRSGDLITVKESRGLWLRVSSDEFSDGWVYGKYIKRLKVSGTKDSTETAYLKRSNPLE